MYISNGFPAIHLHLTKPIQTMATKSVKQSVKFEKGTVEFKENVEVITLYFFPHTCFQKFKRKLIYLRTKFADTILVYKKVLEAGSSYFLSRKWTICYINT